MCWFLGLKLEEVKELSMHRWGATAGCSGYCQSQESFLIISTHYTSHASSYSSSITSHTHTLRLDSLGDTQHFWASQPHLEVSTLQCAHTELLLFKWQQSNDKWITQKTVCCECLLPFLIIVKESIRKRAWQLSHNHFFWFALCFHDNVYCI